MWLNSIKTQLNEQNQRCYLAFEGIIKAYSHALLGEENVQQRLRECEELGKDKCCLSYSDGSTCLRHSSQTLVDQVGGSNYSYSNRNNNSSKEIQKPSLRDQLREMESLHRKVSTELAQKVKLLDNLEEKHRILESSNYENAISVDFLMSELQRLQLELLESEARLKEYDGAGNGLSNP